MLTLYVMYIIKISSDLYLICYVDKPTFNNDIIAHSNLTPVNDMGRPYDRLSWWLDTPEFMMDKYGQQRKMSRSGSYKIIYAI